MEKQGIILTDPVMGKMVCNGIRKIECTDVWTWEQIVDEERWLRRIIEEHYPAYLCEFEKESK